MLSSTHECKANMLIVVFSALFHSLSSRWYAISSNKIETHTLIHMPWHLSCVCCLFESTRVYGTVWRKATKTYIQCIYHIIILYEKKYTKFIRAHWLNQIEKSVQKWIFKNRRWQSIDYYYYYYINNDIYISVFAFFLPMFHTHDQINNIWQSLKHW